MAKAEPARDLSSFFRGTQGCFLLYNLTTDKMETTYGGDLCKKAVSPASTFKIANSLIGLNLGILEDENTIYRWNKTPQPIPSWEKDQTLKSAVRDSVVWYFQMVARQVGEENYIHYLKMFNYGNHDISGGLDHFWLGSSLKITPEEQLEFLIQLYKNQLPVSTHTTVTVKKILILEEANNKILSGKTGSTSTYGTTIGWFVGYLKNNRKEYLFVTNIQTKGDATMINGESAGKAAKTITKQILPWLRVM